MRARPFPTEAETAHAREIAVGCDRAGFIGSYWRLAACCDVQQVHKWCLGERIRGVPPEELFDAMAWFISDAVITTSYQMPRHLVREAARDILKNAAKLVHAEVARVLEAKKTAAVLQSHLRVV